MERESMEFDVLIIGAGPAGLAAAIQLAQHCQHSQRELSICVLEKAASIGAHNISGAVLEPSALNQLIPDWQEKGAPVRINVNEDHFYYLTETTSKSLPTPKAMHNTGNFIISLSQFSKWLGEQAEQLGVNVFPGFAATKVLYKDDRVIGIQTGDMGLDEHNQPTDQYQPGMQLLAKQTLFAEGCRGNLSEELIAKYHLREHCGPQTYGIGIKEVWQINPEKHHPGRVTHTVGWPLDKKTYGGSFIYHLENNQLAIGLVVGLDYQNPYFDPYEEFQRFKTHPNIRPLLEGGECIAYGARALNEGGLQAIPKLTFPGGMLIGCAAGFLNVAKIKGIHNAMHSGMLAADTIFESLDTEPELTLFSKKIKQSIIYKELHQCRNLRPAFHKGLWAGLAYSAFDQFILRGKAPWTFKNCVDHDSLMLASKAKKINYPKPDNIITFDRLTQIFLSNIHYKEHQPNHLKLRDSSIPIKVNLAKYAAPEQRYCPAGVYEIVQADSNPQLQINAANCIQCKTCDIKDPLQNIQWTPPEGGDGPNYTNL